MLQLNVLAEQGGVVQQDDGVLHALRVAEQDEGERLLSTRLLVPVLYTRSRGLFCSEELLRLQSSAIKNQRRANKQAFQSHLEARAGSLWRKIAGVATPRNSPRHRV